MCIKVIIRRSTRKKDAEMMARIIKNIDSTLAYGERVISINERHAENNERRISDLEADVEKIKRSSYPALDRFETHRPAPSVGPDDPKPVRPAEVLNGKSVATDPKT